MKLSIITKTLAITALLVGMLSVFVLPSTVQAHDCLDLGASGDDAGHSHDGGSIGECVDSGACLDSHGTACPSQDSESLRVDNMIKTVVNIISFVVGVVAVIMIIIGGLKYITSGGDSGKVTGAKNTILYAIIGLVIVVLAQVIVRFVITKTDAVPDEPEAGYIKQLEADQTNVV